VTQKRGRQPRGLAEREKGGDVRQKTIKKYAHECFAKRIEQKGPPADMANGVRDKPGGRRNLGSKVNVDDKH